MLGLQSVSVFFLLVRPNFQNPADLEGIWRFFVGSLHVGTVRLPVQLWIRVLVFLKSVKCPSCQQVSVRVESTFNCVVPRIFTTYVTRLVFSHFLRLGRLASQFEGLGCQVNVISDLELFAEILETREGASADITVVGFFAHDANVMLKHQAANELEFCINTLQRHKFCKMTNVRRELSEPSGSRRST